MTPKALKGSQENILEIFECVDIRKRNSIIAARNPYSAGLSLAEPMFLSQPADEYVSAKWEIMNLNNRKLSTEIVTNEMTFLVCAIF